MERTDIRVIGRAGEYDAIWHWVVFHDAVETPARVYDADGGADTICGILIGKGPLHADFREEPTPDEPDCKGCATLGLPPAVFEALRDALGVPESVPV